MCMHTKIINVQHVTMQNYKIACIAKCFYGAVQNDLEYMRVRSSKHELMVAPCEWLVASRVPDCENTPF